jgi:hypothetical protein
MQWEKRGKEKVQKHRNTGHRRNKTPQTEMPALGEMNIK